LSCLQRQKIWSYAQNAQLQRDVEELQRQLAQFDEIFNDVKVQTHSSTFLTLTGTGFQVMNLFPVRSQVRFFTNLTMSSNT